MPWSVIDTQVTLHWGQWLFFLPSRYQLQIAFVDGSLGFNVGMDVFGFL